jgi:hypothetical protein
MSAEEAKFGRQYIWVPADVIDALSNDMIAPLMDILRRGQGRGPFYTSSRLLAGRWAVSKNKASRIVDLFVQLGVIEVEIDHGGLVVRVIANPESDQ